MVIDAARQSEDAAAIFGRHFARTKFSDIPGEAVEMVKIIKELRRLKELGFPILIGTSMKAFIGKIAESTRVEVVGIMTASAAPFCSPRTPRKQSGTRMGCVSEGR
jgi:hypothetical protein